MNVNKKSHKNKSVECDVSTHLGLFWACTRSGIVQIFKSLHSYWLFRHSQYKYIINILIFFVGWLGHNQDGRGTRTSEGIKRVQVYRPSSLRFTPRGNEVPRVPIHLFSLIYCKHASRLRANSIWPWLPCLILRVFRYWSVLPKESLQSSDVQCRIGDIHSHMDRLTHLTYILKATSPTRN